MIFSNGKVVISNQEPASHVAVSPSEQQEENAPKKDDFLPLKLIKLGINFFFDFLETIVVALSIFVVIYLFIVQPHEVKGNSMEPNFHNNEYILTDKISYRFNEPKRGDVVIFKAPVNPDVDYIKRIIGLPGEKVKVYSGEVYLNGERLNELYLESPTPLFPNSMLKDNMEITVPESFYFVMGDNRPHSSDSREFGPIDKKLIIGKAVFRYWPLNSTGLIPAVNYRF